MSRLADEAIEVAEGLARERGIDLIDLIHKDPEEYQRAWQTLFDDACQKVERKYAATNCRKPSSSL